MLGGWAKSAIATPALPAYAMERDSASMANDTLNATSGPTSSQATRLNARRPILAIHDWQARMPEVLSPEMRNGEYQMPIESRLGGTPRQETIYGIEYLTPGGKGMVFQRF